MKFFSKIKVFLMCLVMAQAGLVPASRPSLVMVRGFVSAHETTIKRTLVSAAAAVGVASVAWFASALAGNSWQDIQYFFKEIAKNPAQMGAAFPCSKHLAKASIAHLPPRLDGKPRRFLEVGAGTGVVTAQFVKQLQPGDTLDLVELQAPLCEILKKKFGYIKGVSVHCTPVEEFNPTEKYDAIVMTVPFNSLPFGLVKTIWSHVIGLLADKGTVSYVSYLGLPKIKTMSLSGLKKKDFQKIQTYLDGLHQKNGVGEEEVLRNVPPIRVRYLQFDHEVAAPCGAISHAIAAC